MAAGILLAATPARCSNAAMKGPPYSRGGASRVEIDHDFCSLRLLAASAITFYREFVSPTQGQRCGFFPSCSSFGLQAVSARGPFLGVMMTTDRLMRCNLLTGPGPDYYLLPNGNLYDPISSNLPAEP